VNVFFTEATTALFVRERSLRQVIARLKSRGKIQFPTSFSVAVGFDLVIDLPAESFSSSLIFLSLSATGPAGRAP